MFFQDVPQGPPDPVYILKNAVDADKSPEKVDLGVGVYRNEKALYNELSAIKEAKKVLTQKELGHDYEVTTGDAQFVKHAAAVLFGKDNKAIQSSRTTSVQAISGTGSIHLAALFLSRCAAFKGKKVYIGAPAWGNYEPLFNLVGLEVVKYKYYDAAAGVVDFKSVLDAVAKAPEGSIFVLQGCCHNPSGADLKADQWRELAKAMKPKKLFPFFDMAYQGLGGSLEDDAYGLRHFEELGFELLACQSFSKNFGLYGERCGVLHVVSESEKVAANVYDQLRCLIRWEFSSSPAYGSRLVNTILESEELTTKWTDELITMRRRLVGLRKALYDELVEKRKTPGNWEAILSSTGLFCFLPLNPQQVSSLATKYHIYMLQSGRINVSGMNQSNIERIASSIDQVVRSSATVSAHL
ncbi:aspartate aminotransferase [Cucurbitaria berberidis CBS 394.84]|uniref:Aspartate aminotransferase n=1 Tax=Cucurbitaria berberidis CBS 394.84 TaxID=1168544 RepID=A0A9P4GTT2_9PLEO|nr:aspartate aminotransferase [Cucurbitaria berberidis CBS 394.84]KAF1851672.1 aspartate aminotransferase [Cucurbitaria berberidis CBS 394.84]